MQKYTNNQNTLNQMKKLRNLFFVLITVTLFSSCGYNKMVGMQEGVDAQWAQVENVYQRRADLIPNLVATVKGYAAHEQETLQGVVEARAKATGVNLTADKLTPENLQKFQQAQSGLSSALSRLMVVVEKYPDLKANENFLQLQAQIEGSENRISVERRKFNDAARAYNTYIKQFPRNFYSGSFGFEKKPYFAADAGAQTAPKVEF